MPSSPGATLDLFIGGFLDAYTGIVSAYESEFRQQYPQRHSACFQHHQQAQILASIKTCLDRHPDTAINLIGHSWGAARAVTVARALAEEGITVNKVVTIDPVCRAWKRGRPGPAIWINVNAAPATSNGLRGDGYATVGGKWGDWPEDKAACHLNAPYHHNEFRALLEYVPSGGRSALAWLLEGE